MKPPEAPERAQKADIPVWKALADPTRRAVLDVLRAGPLPTGRLAERFDMTRFGVMKHLRVLHEAGLTLVEERGRERWNHLNPVPIREIYQRWIRPFEEEHADRLLRLKRLAERLPEESNMSDMHVENILVEVQIQAPIERVWKTMVVETTEWWHQDFYTAPAPKGFHIEPVLGGRMFEDWGDGAGQIWGQVNGVRAPEYLQIVGDTSKEWGGPHRSVMTWTLTEADGETALRLEHSIFGHVSQSTRDSLKSGWQQLFGGCLKPYVETGQVPEAATT